jgi:hypothetical protein
LPFHHMTLVRFRGGVSPAAASAAVIAGRGLEPQIPVIRSMSCGLARPSDTHDWTLAFEFAFDDEAAFLAFAAHGAHDAFVEQHIHPHAELVSSVDFTDD